MKVYELIRKLTEYGPDQEVIFDVFVPDHEVNLDFGERKVSGELSVCTNIDLHTDYVEELFEKKNRNNEVQVHISISC